MALVDGTAPVKEEISIMQKLKQWICSSLLVVVSVAPGLGRGEGRRAEGTQQATPPAAGSRCQPGHGRT